LALLTAATKVPDQLTFIRARLPIIRLWFDPTAQQRLQLGAVPYDMLRAADATLPRDAAVLLLTSGRDIRHLEYTTFHRALYFLAPRPVWWLAPAPSDGTWEARWWISAPLTPETISAVAAEKGVSYVLAYDLSQPLSLGHTIANLGAGELRQLDTRAAGSRGDSSLAGQPARAAYAGPTWPIRLALALAIILSLGYAVVAVIARMGYRATGIEAAALAWPLGAGLTSIVMLWLNAVGVGLYGQIAMVTTLAVGGMVWSWKFRRAGAGEPEGARVHASSRPAALPRLLRAALAALLLGFLALQIALVATMAVGQPLNVWDSWSSWGLKARTIFLEESISPAVYADPSRASTLPLYPLLVPLVEAWIYAWLGAPDDRLVGAVSVLFYLALAGICFAAVRRRGATRSYALGVTVVVATIPYVALLAGLVFIDVPLAVFATLAAIYLLDWMDSGARGALVTAALAAGLMPWTKREGLVLLMMLCLAALAVGRSVRQRAWRGVGATLLAAALLAGPWWVFITWNGGTNPDFMPLTVVTLRQNVGRLPIIAQMARTELLSANWSHLWPLAVLCGLIGWIAQVGVYYAAVASDQHSRGRREDRHSFGSLWPRGSVGAPATFRRDSPGRVPAEGAMKRGTATLLPLMILLYLGAMGLGYMFSGFVPYQEHIESSFFRLIAHVVPILVLWMAYQGIEADATIV
jgi:hypothetical protein